MQQQAPYLVPRGTSGSGKATLVNFASAIQDSRQLPQDAFNIRLPQRAKAYVEDASSILDTSTYFRRRRHRRLA